MWSICCWAPSLPVDTETRGTAQRLSPWPVPSHACPPASSLQCARSQALRRANSPRTSSRWFSHTCNGFKRPWQDPSVSAGGENGNVWRYFSRRGAIPRIGRPRSRRNETPTRVPGCRQKASQCRAVGGAGAGLWGRLPAGTGTRTWGALARKSRRQTLPR